MTIKHPVYSICICNYNMADFLEEALSSVLSQLNDEFEVVVVDDGSSDGSVGVLRQIQRKYSNLRVFAYARDQNRYLGATRNLSVKHATGKYVVLHIDADDVWEPGIVQWCKEAKILSEIMGDDVYLAGKQINMVSRAMLKDFGGYRNIFYTEDRDLWTRLAAAKKIAFIEHETFRIRMPLSPKIKFIKRIKTSWHILLNDIRTTRRVGPALFPVFLQSVTSWKIRGWANVLLRLSMFPFAAVVAVGRGAVEDYKPSLSAAEWRKYKKINTRTFDQWRESPEII